MPETSHFIAAAAPTWQLQRRCEPPPRHQLLAMPPMLQAAQAPCASEVVRLHPDLGISKTVMPRRKVSSQLRLLASVPETKNYTY